MIKRATPAAPAIPSTVYALSAFSSHDGECVGHYTSLSSISTNVHRARVYDSKQAALEDLPSALSVWAPWKFSWRATRVEIGVDTRVIGGVRSSTQATNKADRAMQQHRAKRSIQQDNPTSNGGSMATDDKKAKLQAKKKALLAKKRAAETNATKATKATKHSKRAEKASTVAKASTKTRANANRTAPTGAARVNVCLCCKGKTANSFVRGHVRRFIKNLADVKAGIEKPKDVFKADVYKAMGPWKPTRSGGFVPTVTDYRTLTAATN